MNQDNDGYVWRHSRLARYAVAGLFVVAGIATLVATRAATTAVSAEAESGTANGVVTIDDQEASGGQAVRFDPVTGGVSLLKETGSYRTIQDLRYSDSGSRTTLDLYLPDHDGPFPLIVWVHGGGWLEGSKADCTPAQAGYMRYGFAVACINYRLSDEAVFPAQIIDVKSAVRWLRANASAYKLFSPKIGIWGYSAGGHLSALAGTSNGVSKFDVGDNLDQSSAVQAVVGYSSPTDLVAFVQTPGFEYNTADDSPPSRLLGGPVLDKRSLAAEADPATYVGSGDPPFLLFHGDQDDTVPWQQSQLLHDALRQAGRSSEFSLLPGTGHVGGELWTEDTYYKVGTFFDNQLR